MPDEAPVVTGLGIFGELKLLFENPNVPEDTRKIAQDLYDSLQLMRDQVQ